MDEHREREPPLSPPIDDLGFPLPEPVALGKRRGLFLLLALLLACAALFVLGYLPRLRAKSRLIQAAHEVKNQRLAVETLRPKRVEGVQEIALPGSIAPLASTVLYPRAQGYVKRFLVDLGDRVEAGQVLAEIETPELDQQLEQARAELLQAEARRGQAQANRDLSKASLERYKALRPAGVASQQELEQRAAQALVDEANVAAADAAIAVQRANLRRLVQLKSFAEVSAPFAGVVTSRTIDVGALVSSGNTTPLFELVATDPVRVFVQVPQDVAPSVRTGIEATVSVREFPAQPFTGEVARTSGALDATTRTLRTEVRVPNPDNTLLTGMYAEVRLPLATPHTLYELPATSVMSDAEGVRVATVDGSERIHLVPVVIERDLGATMQIASGLSGDERVVRLGSGALREGLSVSARDEAPREK